MFFFNDAATTEIYTLSLHDALPIFRAGGRVGLAGAHAPLGGDDRDRRRLRGRGHVLRRAVVLPAGRHGADRKSTRLNSSHANISYAAFCLTKKLKGETGPTEVSPLV